ncbi:MAG: response regulator [bacterium]
MGFALLMQYWRKRRSVSSQFSILVADPSRNVRDFLRRELAAEGYRVDVAGDERELFEKLNVDEPPDLLVVDLEITFGGGMELLDRLCERVPPVPVVVHTLFTRYATHPSVLSVDAFVEKTGNPARLKMAIEKVLRKHYEHRFVSAENNL